MIFAPTAYFSEQHIFRTEFRTRPESKKLHGAIHLIYSTKVLQPLLKMSRNTYIAYNLPYLEAYHPIHRHHTHTHSRHVIISLAFLF